MAQFENMHKVDLAGGNAPIVQMKWLAQNDKLANRFGAIVTRNGQAVELGGGCSGTAILDDGSTVPLTGTVDGNEAWVELPDACYTVEGQIIVAVNWYNGDARTTLIWGVGTVKQTETGTVIDPGTVIDSVTDLIQAIEDAVDSIPPDYSALVSATNNYLIKSNLPVMTVDDAAVELLTNVSGIVKLDGTTDTSTVYKIATFAADGSKTYKISHQTGASYATIRTIELIKNNQVIQYIGAENNEIAEHYITNFGGTVRICYRAQNANSLVIYEQKAELAKDFETLKNAIVDPDDYAGTDSEKIQAAMAEIGDTGHGVILIKRPYTLTASINISHNAEENKRIIFVGAGKEAGFNMGQYRFKSADQTQSYGMIGFENVYFTGTGVLFASEFLLRITFSNCVFGGGTNAVRNSRYMQSWTFIGCTFRDFSSYVIYSALPEQGDPDIRIYDVVFMGCLVERCAGFLYTNKLIGCSIMQCCIEGLTGYVCNVVAQARSLTVIGNYFEHNNDRIENPEYEDDNTQPRYIGNGGNGVHFNFERLVGNLFTIKIEGNNFVTAVYAPDTENNIILLPPNKPKIGYISIKDNDVSYASNIYIAKAYDTATDIYSNVLLSGNTNGNYNGGENDLLIDSDLANLGTVTDVLNGTALSSLTQPGLFFVGSDVTVSDRPAEGDLFIINLRGDKGKAQLAICENGLKSRLNDGEWI